MAYAKSTADYKQVSVKEALELSNATLEGLSEEEAAKRAKVFGFNEVTEKKTNALLDFLSRFWGPMPWLLEVAALLSFFVHQMLDAIIIAALLVVNTVIGYFNESNSKKALELLKKKLAVQSRLLRGGKWVLKQARELVPGDIIVVRLGDIVPADAKIISGGLSVDQAALTGESLPIDARESDILFTGSVVKRGEAKCVVVNTGMNTYFGKTVELVNIAAPKSRQQQIMMTISRNMMYLGALAFVIVFFYALIIGSTILTIATFAVLFISSGIPVALPVMFTIAQAAGATELSKKGVMVTKLDAIENAASVEFLCLDKTGTITMNELEVSEVITFQGYGEDDVLGLASLASREEDQDAIDAAVIRRASTHSAYNAYKQVSFTPFDPSTKRTEAIVELNGKRLRAVKGAPQIVLSLCGKADPALQQRVSDEVQKLSLKGCRALAVAKSEGGAGLELAGLLALSDPLRPDSKEMISEIRSEGIKPVMLTGDNISVAREIAGQAGIGSRIARIAELKELDEKEQAEKIGELDGIAEIYPEDKFHIVKLLQSQGHLVGMTGDGVNDAPALKQAEMGIAVNNAADVAKAAASMVLMEPGTKVIVEAVKTSRRIFQRLLTWALNKIVKCIQFLGILTIGFFWFQDVVVSISGLLLVLFANDFMTLSLAKDNAESTANPNKWNIKNLTLAAGFLGMMLVVEGVIAMWVCTNYFGMQMAQLRAAVLLTLVYTGQLCVLVARERRHFWSSMPGKSVLATSTIAILAFTALAVAGVVLAPLPPEAIGFLFGFAAVFVLALDIPKYFVFKKLGI